MEKEIFITVDPGYDSIKLILESEKHTVSLKIPFNVEETDERKYNDTWVKDTFLVYRSKNLLTYRVGEYARELVFENKKNDSIKTRMPEFYSEKRFLNDDFIIGVRSAIAKALLKYESEVPEFEISNLSEYKMYLMLALPHATQDEFADPVANKFKGKNEFDIKIGKSEYVSISFKIDRENIYTVSQTIAAIIGQTSDDEGNLNQETLDLLLKGPTLVIDAGYYTTGLVVISDGGSVDNKLSESDTNHAMRNVNIKVSEAIKDKRPDIEFYVVEYLCNKNDGIVKFKNGENKTETFNIKEIKEEKIKELCAEFIEYLNSKYNNLLDFNYVVIDGGTGSQYFPILRKHYVEENETFKENQLILASSTINGQRLSIEYSIAVGAHKALKGKVSTLVA
ncbi:hypothetical protein [Clostridium tyrobutyricum]|uniref:hypothetical protein n=1 Tax=Clostridium tyrobutyricum TaxID=1519 RepID=UPI0011C76EED|nr:hypothetical protein [Clostridium tyrobutyricum]